MKNKAGYCLIVNAVLESLDCLGRNDQKRLMTAVDKVFPEFEEFEKSGQD